MEQPSRITREDVANSRVDVSTKKVSNIIAERTGLRPDIVGLVIEEYGLYLMEALFINRQTVLLFGIGTLHIYDRGFATKKGLNIIKRLRLKFTIRPRTRALVSKLNEGLDQGMEMPKDYKAYMAETFADSKKKKSNKEEIKKTDTEQ